MANTITKNVISNGPRNLVLDIHISGDNSGDETAHNLVDVSAYGADEVKIMSVQSNLAGFSATLRWDATSDVEAVQLLDGASFYDYSKHGGLINNAGAGKTGDILMATSGLASEDGSIILEMRKRSA